MGPHVNFIGDRLRSRAEAVRLARLGPWAVIAVGLVLVGIVGSLSKVASLRAERLDLIRQQTETITPRAAASRLMAAELERLDGPRRLVRDVHANNARWHGLLREVRDRLPSDTWFTSLEVRPTPGGQEALSVTIAGQATGHQAIGEYVQALCQSPWFAAASLVRTGPDTADKPTSGPIEFVIEARLKQPILPRAESS